MELGQLWLFLKVNVAKTLLQMNMACVNVKKVFSKILTNQNAFLAQHLVSVTSFVSVPYTQGNSWRRMKKLLRMIFRKKNLILELD